MTEADRLAERAPAKVNLFLHVTGKRADGYHLLDSFPVFAGVADRLSFQPVKALSLTVTGPFAAALSAEPDNLVLRAAHRLAEACGVRPGGALTLEKHIPVASGIGGGSADAAAALRLLCRAWDVAPGSAVLEQIAAGLGADVPVCVRNQPLRMRGIGEILTPAPILPECGMVLVNPGIPLATAAVFRARARGAPLRSRPRRGCRSGGRRQATWRRRCGTRATIWRRRRSGWCRRSGTYWRRYRPRQAVCWRG